MRSQKKESSWSRICVKKPWLLTLYRCAPSLRFWEILIGQSLRFRSPNPIIAVCNDFISVNVEKRKVIFSIRRDLPIAARVDLEWWLANLTSVNGKQFFPKVPDVEICSDACLSGWGSVCNGVTARGPWTRSDSAKHINELELLGALFALESFLGDARELSVRLYLDNTTAVCYINKNGGTRSLALSSAAIRLTEFCESPLIGRGSPLSWGVKRGGRQKIPFRMGFQRLDVVPKFV